MTRRSLSLTCGAFHLELGFCFETPQLRKLMLPLGYSSDAPGSVHWPAKRMPKRPLLPDASLFDDDEVDFCSVFCDFCSVLCSVFCFLTVGGRVSDC